jgi:hypothetical protein
LVVGQNVEHSDALHDDQPCGLRRIFAPLNGRSEAALRGRGRVGIKDGLIGGSPQM